MGAGHSHDVDPKAAANVVTRTAKTVLVVTLSVLGVLAIGGIVFLWPHQDRLDAISQETQFTAPGVSVEKARIDSMNDQCPSQLEVPEENRTTCYLATTTVTTGPDQGTTATVELIGPPTSAGIRVGDTLVTMRTPNGETAIYTYFGVERMPVIWVMLALFIVVVLAVARWKGLWALVGLVFSGAVLFFFLLPALASGQPAVWVGLVGSVAIMFVVLYVAHGVSFRTSAALAGTIISLALSTALGAAAVWFGRLSGLADESEMTLASMVPGLNFRELLIAAMIVAGLGVLNDVTITQASAVYELRSAAPSLSRRQAFTSGMRIGRDHIASTIYTIVFAYAGAALSVLLLVYFYDRPVIELLSTEQFGSEVLRTLAAATGLVISVPITTAITALTLKPAEPMSPVESVTSPTSDIVTP